jgi:hypothetical protein
MGNHVGSPTARAGKVVGHSPRLCVYIERSDDASYAKRGILLMVCDMWSWMRFDVG